MNTVLSSTTVGQVQRTGHELTTNGSVDPKLPLHSARGIKKRQEWPYLATCYVQAWVFMLFCTYLMVLYSIAFTNRKANDWLMVSILSMGTDMMVMEPVKIVGKAIQGFFCFAAAAAAGGGLNEMLGFNDED